MKNFNGVFIVFFALVLGSTTFQATAQTLERKGTFGVQMENMEDKSGIKVIATFDNTTASGIGIKKGDVMLSVNGKTYTDVFDLVDDIGTWRKGQSITVKVKRDGKTQKLKGQIVGKPLETSKYGKVIYGEVPYDGGKLRSILERPNDVENPPVVLFLPGIGCGSLDYFYNPNATIKLLIEDLVRQGIAVYRVEKPGMGDSYGTKDCLEMDYDYEVNAFKAALAKLQTISTVNTDQIFLYGHSMGVITAPLVAKGNKIAGIISWGGISTTWYEYLLKMRRDQQILLGGDYVEVESDLRTQFSFLYDFFVNKKSPETLAKVPEYEEYVKSTFRDGVWHGLHHYSFFQNLNEVNILTAYKEANCPVLTVAGEFDIHAIDTDWAEEIATAVNFYRPNQGEFIVIPKTVHHYHTVPSLEVYNEMREKNTLTGRYMSAHFNEDVPMVVGRWIKKQILILEEDKG